MNVNVNGYLPGPSPEGTFSATLEAAGSGFRDRLLRERKRLPFAVVEAESQALKEAGEPDPPLLSKATSVTVSLFQAGCRRHNLKVPAVAGDSDRSVPRSRRRIARPAQRGSPQRATRRPSSDNARLVAHRAL